MNSKERQSRIRHMEFLQKKYHGVKNSAHKMCHDSFASVEPGAYSVESSLFLDAVDDTTGTIQKLCDEIIRAYRRLEQLEKE